MRTEPKRRRRAVLWLACLSALHHSNKDAQSQPLARNEARAITEAAMMQKSTTHPCSPSARAARTSSTCSPHCTGTAQHCAATHVWELSRDAAAAQSSTPRLRVWGT